MMQSRSVVTLILLFAAVLSCREEKRDTATLFELLPAGETGIDFGNTLDETEDFNIIQYLYFYNGGGVAIGDINNDGWSDLYFISNQHGNRLYLNKGNFKFEDITANAGVAGAGNWKTGAALADVNGDGLLDIFVCGVGNYKKFDGRNQLFINNGDLTFTEKADEAGLAFRGLSTQASFFDYDNDGDLDMYLLNHSVHSTRAFEKSSVRLQHDSISGDRLYRNELVPSGTLHFTNVTTEAGIFNSRIGYGLGIGISDINRDGYADMYVSNDFAENDYLYINQKNGTFHEEIARAMSHSSRFSMGNDIADFNNDLWPDIVTLDMLPRDETVIKSSVGEDSYEIYSFKLKYGYQKQVSRNTLQLNLGAADSGRVIFSDIAPLAGVEATDWSWSPMLADFDGDGFKDLFISNGIMRRPNDLNYLNFISSDSVQKTLQTNSLSGIRHMPEGRVSDFMFRNSHNLTFEDKTAAWGVQTPSVSSGAAYGDLDNDGDPDLVVNNINEPAFIYRNQSKKRFLNLHLKGDSTSANRFAIGAKVVLEQDSLVQLQELYPQRGWCSSSDHRLGFAQPEGKYALRITWPDGTCQRIEGPLTDQEIVYAKSRSACDDHPAGTTPLMKRVQLAEGYRHQENEFNAFNRESLMPHMLTTEGPPLAVADVDGDGLEDFFVGGAQDQGGVVYRQTGNHFTPMPQPAFRSDARCEDVDAAFFDVDNDDDMDLIVVSGGQETVDRSNVLMPRLYINNGKGNFTRSKSALPEIYLNASCVKPFDYDHDGDMDVFIGSSVMAFLYGMSPVSYLLVNDGKGTFRVNQQWLGRSQFDNATRVRPGMVKDAVWADVNGDRREDLVLVGEWMPVTVLIQQADHTFSNQTPAFGLSGTRGWWNAVIADDFDHDGDLDLVAGNLGMNSRLKASADKPLKMLLGDFDANGGSDHILVYYNGDRQYPFVSRDQLVKQLPHLKKKFLHYENYRDAVLSDIVTPEQKQTSAELTIDMLQSVYLRNDGQHFEVVPLPMEAQVFPLETMLSDDVDHDGNLDIILAGNFTATQPDIGPYDAGIGLVLKGDGHGHFESFSPMRSGFVVKGEARDIAVVHTSQNQKIYLVSRNNDSLVAFQP
jgi:hypothetical protein